METREQLYPLSCSATLNTPKNNLYGNSQNTYENGINYLLTIFQINCLYNLDLHPYLWPLTNQRNQQFYVHIRCTRNRFTIDSMTVLR